MPSCRESAPWKIPTRSCQIRVASWCAAPIGLQAQRDTLEARRSELEKAAAAKLAESQALGEKLAGSTAKLTQKAGVDGRLFGSVTNADIAEELGKLGYKVVKSQIRMPNGPIKVVGDSTVSVALHTDVVVDITVSVYGETA